MQYTQSQAQFNTYVNAGTVLNNYAHIFDILIRLRQAVVHPYLVTLNDTHTHTQTYTISSATSNPYQRFTLQQSKQEPQAEEEEEADSSETEDANSSNALEQDRECLLCTEPTNSEDYIRNPACGHGFCRFCLSEYFNTITGATPVASAAAAKKMASSVTCPCTGCKKHIQADILSQPQALLEEDDEDGDNEDNKRKRTKEQTPKKRAKKAAVSDGTENNHQIVSVWNPHTRRRKSILDKIDLSNFQTSTKMEALMEV